MSTRDRGSDRGRGGFKPPASERRSTDTGFNSIDAAFRAAEERAHPLVTAFMEATRHFQFNKPGSAVLAHARGMLASAEAEELATIVDRLLGSIKDDTLADTSSVVRAITMVAQRMSIEGRSDIAKRAYEALSGEGSARSGLATELSGLERKARAPNAPAHHYENARSRLRREILCYRSILHNIAEQLPSEESQTKYRYYLDTRLIAALPHLAVRKYPGAVKFLEAFESTDEHGRLFILSPHALQLLQETTPKDRAYLCHWALNLLEEATPESRIAGLEEMGKTVFANLPADDASCIARTIGKQIFGTGIPEPSTEIDLLNLLLPTEGNEPWTHSRLPRRSRQDYRDMGLLAQVHMDRRKSRRHPGDEEKAVKKGEWSRLRLLELQMLTRFLGLAGSAVSEQIERCGYADHLLTLRESRISGVSGLARSALGQIASTLPVKNQADYYFRVCDTPGFRPTGPWASIAQNAAAAIAELGGNQPRGDSFDSVLENLKTLLRNNDPRVHTAAFSRLSELCDSRPEFEWPSIASRAGLLRHGTSHAFSHSYSPYTEHTPRPFKTAEQICSFLRARALLADSIEVRALFAFELWKIDLYSTGVPGAADLNQIGRDTALILETARLLQQAPERTHEQDDPDGVGPVTAADFPLLLLSDLQAERRFGLSHTERECPARLTAILWLLPVLSQNQRIEALNALDELKGVNFEHALENCPADWRTEVEAAIADTRKAGDSNKSLIALLTLVDSNEYSDAFVRSEESEMREERRTLAARAEEIAKMFTASEFRKLIEDALTSSAYRNIDDTPARSTPFELRHYERALAYVLPEDPDKQPPLNSEALAAVREHALKHLSAFDFEDTSQGERIAFLISTLGRMTARAPKLEDIQAFPGKVLPFLPNRHSSVRCAVADALGAVCTRLPENDWPAISRLVQDMRWDDRCRYTVGTYLARLAVAAVDPKVRNELVELLFDGPEVPRESPFHYGSQQPAPCLQTGVEKLILMAAENGDDELVQSVAGRFKEHLSLEAARSEASGLSRHSRHEYVTSLIKILPALPAEQQVEMLTEVLPYLSQSRFDYFVNPASQAVESAIKLLGENERREILFQMVTRLDAPNDPESADDNQVALVNILAGNLLSLERDEQVSYIERLADIFLRQKSVSRNYVPFGPHPSALLTGALFKHHPELRLIWNARLEQASS